METNRKIIILRGAPGSGKTTYAKKLVKEQRFKRVNRDDLRDMFNFYSFDKKDESFITRLQEMFFIMAMNEGYNVVVDNTHAKQKYITDLEEQVKIWNSIANDEGPEYKYDVEIITMDTSLEECIRRNNLRDRKVPEDVIRTMYNNIKN